MKIENVHHRDQLLTEWKRRQINYEQASVPTSSVPKYESEGWIEIKRGKQKTRIKRFKSIPVQVEDRIWTVLYKMGFLHLNGEGGAKLRQNDTVWNQIDALAYDDDTALVIECKSAEQLKSKEDLQKDMALLEQHRNNISQILRTTNETKVRVGSILVLFDINLSETEIERAKASRITLIDATALDYYERLVEHTGSASKYQLLGEVFAGQDIDGLKITIPAVEARLGKNTIYTFAITPSHLLKLAYVAHRSRGELGVEGAYQRMVKKSRLQAISEFIDEGGIFPTNIVINFNEMKKDNKSGLRFEQTNQPYDSVSNVRLGWLHLPARYQSAWIIDGQHRLFAYSGNKWADKSTLNVTAFDGLDAGEQSYLFTKINSEQKKVSGNLLTELDADINWNSPDEEKQAHSIATKAVMSLAQRSTSPFYHRILMADEVSSSTKCISLKSMTDALKSKPGLFLVRKQYNKWVELGPLWAVKPEHTLRRTKTVISEWFSSVREDAASVWDRGREEGGYLAMNNGVVVCIQLLNSVFEHLASKGIKCNALKDEELVSHIRPFGKIVGEFFATRTSPELAQMRRQVGTTGQTEIRRIVQKAIQEEIADFEPEGLDKWLANRADDKVDDAKSRIQSIEIRLRKKIVDMLQESFGHDRDLWWFEVPKDVRVATAKAKEQDNSNKGDSENYLTFKDYRKIILGQWQDLFQPVFSYGTTGNKIERTEWLAKIASLQAGLADKKSVGLQIGDYNELCEFDVWLNQQGI